MPSDPTRLFETFGFEKVGESGDNVFGECPFCEKSKFYLNPAKGLWDCKSGDCQRHGNAYTFIAQVWEHWYEQTSRDAYRRLSQERGIDMRRLRSAGLAFNALTGEWLLPVWSSNEVLVQLRHFVLGRPLFNAPGLKSALYGAHLLAKGTGKNVVWICEGEWDALALRSMLRRGSQPDRVIAVPGANVWKSDWTGLLAQRQVILAYDHDAAGENGLERVAAELQNAQCQVQRIEWPSKLPQGYDVRDFVRDGGTLVEFLELVHPVPFQRVPSNRTLNPAREEVSHKPLSWKGTLATYRRWLHMSPDNEVALRIMFATALSNRLSGDPLWVFIVAPPGGCKTELLLSFHLLPDVAIKSTLTPHSLVSGFRAPNNLDPSLIPQLHGKLFILKDFTEVLQMPRTEREEVYSILRGAYDGMVEKTFGNGLTRSYECHFSMLAGVTHHIQADRTASLGERYLLFKMEGDSIEASIRAAMGNSGRETNMREELAEAAARFLSQEIDVENIPTVPEEMVERLILLARLVALLRGEVAKGLREEVLYRPQPEIGTRLAKQMRKLLVCLQLLDGGPVVTERSYAIVERVALDTCRGFELDLAKEIGRASARGLNMSEAADKTAIPRTTVREKLEDLVMLGVLRKKRSKTAGGPGRPEARYVFSELAAHFWERLPALREDRRKR